MGMRVGIDIGGTKTHAVAVDAAGDVLAESTRPTGRGHEQVLVSAELVVADLAGIIGVAPETFESIGVGIPGTVDVHTGYVSHAVNLGIEGLDLAVELGTRIAVPIYLDNDVNAAVLGAYRVLGHDLASLAYLNVGTGLAAGLVLNGKIHRGFGGFAGEIGHIPVEPNGLLCACGQIGCLETIASGIAIARRWPTDDSQPIRALFRAAEAGEPLAQAVRDRLADGIVDAVRILVLTTDVDAVVIGGGVMTAGRELWELLDQRFTALAASSPFLESVDLRGRVRPVPPGPSVAAIGAALLGETHPALTLPGSAHAGTAFA
jgi:glucokinase